MAGSARDARPGEAEGRPATPDLRGDGGTAAGPDAATATTPGNPGAAAAVSGIDVLAAYVGGVDAPVARKGEPVRLSFTVRNHDPQPRSFLLTPLVRARAVDGFDGVRAASVKLDLRAGEERQVSLTAGPFLEQPDRGQFAFAAGAYAVLAVEIAFVGRPPGLDTAFTGGDFEIVPSEAILLAVAHDTRYLAQLRAAGDAAAFVARALSRPAEVFLPDGASASAGSYELYRGGLAQLLGARVLVRAMPGFRSIATAACADLPRVAGATLGLSRPWADDGGAPHANHGFDAFLGLGADVTEPIHCPGRVGAAGITPGDGSIIRAELAVDTALSLLLGGTPCAPLAGFVLCGAEKHPHYQQSGVFVWHQRTRDQMRSSLVSP